MQTLRFVLRNGIVFGSLLTILVAGRSVLAVDIVDDPVQIDERAAQLAQTSNSLCWEMYRYHQQKPDYAQAYRMAKDIWSQAGMLRDALHDAPMETEVLLQQVAQINDRFGQLEKMLSQWGDGDRSLVPQGTPRTVVTPGVGVDVPFVGVHIGRPRVAVIDDGSPMLERRRLHPNSHGSKRSLEREVAALKVAVEYLAEDAGMGAPGAAPAPGASPTPAPAATPTPAAKPVPNPPEPASDETSSDKPVKINPPRAKTTSSTKSSS